MTSDIFGNNVSKLSESLILQLASSNFSKNFNIYVLFPKLMRVNESSEFYLAGMKENC